MPFCCFSKTLRNGLETREGQALSPEVSVAHLFKQTFLYWGRLFTSAHWYFCLSTTPRSCTET